MKWLRLYDEILDDPKVQMLPPVLFKFWINLMALANRCEVRGQIDLTSEQIGWKLRLDHGLAAQYLDSLKEAGLIDDVDEGTITPHNWNERQYKSDDATARSKDWRTKGNVASNKEADTAILHATLHETPTATTIPSVNLVSESVLRKGSAEGKPTAPGQTNMPPQTQQDIALQKHLAVRAATLFTSGKLTKAHEGVLTGWFTKHKRQLTPEIVEQGIEAAATYTEGDSLNYLLVVMERCITDPGRGKPGRTNGKARDSGPDLKGAVPPTGYSWDQNAQGEWKAHEWSEDTQSYPYGCSTVTEALNITAEKRQEYIRRRETGKGRGAAA